MKVKRILASVFAGVIAFGCCLGLVGCVDYGYEYHFYVKGKNENGELYAVFGEELVNSYDSPICLMGDGRGVHTVEFLAVPDEGYQVKQWTCNFEVIKENINTYIAHGEKGEFLMVITVEFEPIEEIEGDLELGGDKENQEEQNGGKDYVEDQNVDMVQFHTWQFTSGVLNNIIALKNPGEENCVFECSFDEGCRYFGETKIIESEGQISWSFSRNFDEKSFVEIVVKKEENIIGYALVKIVATNNNWHKPEVVKQALFPKVNGEYQDITEEKMNSIFEELKQGE